MAVNESTKAIVRERAGFRCEYCQLHQDDSPLAVLHVEHIVPRKHGGSDDIENLALACIDCNLHKGPNLTGIDPDTGEILGVEELPIATIQITEVLAKFSKGEVLSGNPEPPQGSICRRARQSPYESEAPPAPPVNRPNW